MARTQIKLNQLIQDGATSNQVISWNGSNWAPSTVTGDGNGIYSASGTIHTGAVATVASGSSFTIDYNGSNPAIIVADTLGTVDIVDKTGLYGFTTGSAASSLYGDGGEVLVDSNTIKLRSAGYIQIGGYASPTPMYFFEGSGSGSNYVSIIAPTTLAANTSYIWPTTTTDAYFLKYNTGGQLEWANAIQQLTLSGTGSTYNIELDGDVTPIQLKAGNNIIMTRSGQELTIGTVGNGIYGGNGTVPSNTVATITDSLTFTENSATNTGVVIPVVLDAKVTSGGAAASFGTGLLFTAETATVNDREIFGIEASWTTVTDATRTGAVAFRLPSSGTYATRLTLNPTSLVPAAAFTIGGGSDTTIGGSTGRAVLQSSGNSADAILLNVNGLTNSSGITLIGANTFTNTGGAKVGVTTSGTFAPTSGTATWTSQAITTTINQTGGANGITRGLHINPTITAAADFRALEIGNTTANTYGIYQGGTSVLNLLSGNTGIGIAPGTDKLRVSGSIRFDLGSDAEGDIFYRNSSGNFVRLPISTTNGHVLTSNGTIPTWAAPGGGSNGIYGGSGTIFSNAVATVGSSSTFTIDYNNGNDAFKVTDASGIFMYAPAAAGNVGVDTSGAAMIFGSNNLIVDSAGINSTGQFKLSSGTLKLNSVLAPAQITADQNNYNPSGLNTAAILRLSSDASRNITGITAPTADTAGHVLIIHNTGSFNIVLKNEDANSTATNRLALAADVTITPNQSHTLVYDATSTRWRSLVTSASSSGATDLAFTGTSSPVTLTSSTGTDVTFTAGTGITLAATSGNITITNSATGVTDHGALTGLADDDHSQYALLAGRSSGQTLIGGTGVTDTLSLVGTAGNGTATSAAILLKVGNNGATTAATILNNGKIGIGATPDASALLDITSTSLGFGLPSMTSTQRNAISSPRDGLVVYNSSDQKLSLRANGAWVDISATPTGFPTISYNSQTGTTYILVLSDAGKMIRASNASAITITIPPNSSVAFPTGTTIYFEQTGAGAVSVAPGSGVTILSTARTTPAQYSTIQIYKIDTDTWNVIGGTI